MRLDPEVRGALDRLLAERGEGPPGGVRAVGGGSIHRAVRVETGGAPVFVKWNAGDAARGFGAEARALEALRRAAADDRLVDVPEVLAWHEPRDEGPGWLVLSWMPPTSPAPDYAERLGRGLAALHRHTAGAFGWSEDNLIGSLPQANPPSDAWADFWRDARIVPQLERARAAGQLGGRTGATLDLVVERIPGALAPVAHEPPSLLHGDLWGGNVHPGPGGRPVLVDPATYHGHREVDLAMSELFGGFPAGFAPAYAEAWPLEDGYAEVRRPLYQLYYLLVHVNLFGRSYVAGTTRAAETVLRGTG